MSAGWIEGRFEGIYSGSLSEVGSNIGKAPRNGRPEKKQVPRSNAKRFKFSIDSGRLTDYSACDAPSEHEGPRDLIRQDRIVDIQIVGSASETTGKERRLALFDVEIRDWELKHPAEAEGRAFGTIVGTLRARRRPVVPVPVEPAPAPREKKGTAAPAPIGAEPEDASRRSEAPFPVSPARTLARARWAILFFALAVIGGIFWSACGAQIAALWLAPIAAALILRRLTGGSFATRAPWWTFSLLIGLQVSVFAFPTIVGGQAATRVCALANDPLNLGLGAAPIVLAGVLGLRGPIWLTGMIWTAMMCAGCIAGGAGGECSLTPPPVSRQTPGVPFGEAETRPRTDASGRWPVMPPVLGQRPGLGGGASPSLPVPAGTDSTLRLPDSGGSGGSGSGGGASDASGQSHGAAKESNLSLGSDSSPASLDPSSQREGASPEAVAALPRPAGKNELASRGGSTAVKGGWVSPDHRRAERKLVLISIEQANRTPPLFFESGGAHRVYVPTDPIFENASAALRPKAQLVLGRVAALLASAPNQRVVLEVHTDSAGSSEAQLGLAGERARAIQDWLLNRGHIASERFQMDAFGGGRPLVPPDGDHRAQKPNRRIEIRLVPGESR